MVKGYTRISLLGVNVINLIKLNEKIEKNNWNIKHYRGYGDIYTLVPSCLSVKVKKILDVIF